MVCPRLMVCSRAWAVIEVGAAKDNLTKAELMCMRRDTANAGPRRTCENAGCLLHFSLATPVTNHQGGEFSMAPLAPLDSC